MSLVIVILAIVCIGVPIAYSVRLWRVALPSRVLWLAVAAEAVVIVGLVLLVGRWDIVGYYSRFVLLAVFLAAVMHSGWRHAARPWRQAVASGGGSVPWPTLLSVVVFGGGLVYLLSGAQTPVAARELAFPLQGGRFVVAQGGGVGVLNHHARHDAQRYAADITAINAAGFRATGVLPRDLDRYAIYGATVVSPCKGEVTAVRDGLPDLVPPRADSDHPAGNHVVVRCDGIDVELAHLKAGSIRISIGDRLAIGTVIGQVGNSGNTTEPHLHIHAVDPETGRGAPIVFDGRWPLRNRLWRRSG